MTPLKKRITALIETGGPLSVADYMALCLFDPQHGYYTTREPFGVAGDFTTAPEISQMFGELIGIWIRLAWESTDKPLPVAIAEIGPGRGTLMKDMLRTLARLAPELFPVARFSMIETSPRLAAIQKKTLATTDAAVEWHVTLDTLPQMPLIIVGNELFDAIPIRQFVRTSGQWRERCIGLDEQGELRFVAGAASLDPSLLPESAANASDGAIFEVGPARTALMDAISQRINAHGGAGLFIDYGHAEPGIGDTLQALRKHRYADILGEPGRADLTAHVDFASLAATARQHGLDATLMTQGDFLLDLGLLERAGRLGAQADTATQEKIRGEVERLAGPDAMGTLFKVLVVRF
ncbi:class I SAM-dependent methyltransferase [Pseudaminobacter arsenicus]|uniref:Class I SAM-dependent methyltransferase n=1 Tax=Borborobacter arsenicus TaxID=1851146 RepID=A0A432V1A4_9HYPH|nr:class I SAM-dependent methyltransferase [Pseudaminobacter arsenicus]RUM95950.1 class I SAM-dependent methyltransferase [Pseudaminobacter arsenicus]